MVHIMLGLPWISSQRDQPDLMPLAPARRILSEGSLQIASTGRRGYAPTG